MPEWPHAPIHNLYEPGTYIVTCGTYLKQKLFNSDNKLDSLNQQLFDVAQEFKWILEAWAVFSNHYHFVAQSPENSKSLKKMLSKLHTLTAKELNSRDKLPGRQVWHNFRDTKITYQKSYLARLKYVHNNPVKHGIVSKATKYKWCSARWFERNASNAFIKTLDGIKIDQLKIYDDF